jgi:hypothetical protein
MADRSGGPRRRCGTSARSYVDVSTLLEVLDRPEFAADTGCIGDGVHCAVHEGDCVIFRVWGREVCRAIRVLQAGSLGTDLVSL